MISETSHYFRITSPSKHFSCHIRLYTLYNRSIRRLMRRVETLHPLADEAFALTHKIFLALMDEAE